jgi:LacI family transcriptional regulator
MARPDRTKKTTRAPAGPSHASANPTLEDVARLAGVSRATASRALATPDKVRAKARNSIAEAVATLGYVRHGPASALASRRTFLIGAVVPTLDNPIFARSLDALQQTIDDAGFALLVATCGYSARRERAGIQTLLERGVDGIVLVGSRRSADTYALLDSKRVACCLTWSSRSSGEEVCVGFDNRLATVKVVDYLYGLGHRRFAMISGLTDENDRAAERLDGARAALAARGLEPIVIERRYLINEGQDGARILMDRSPRPTAIICGNDILALGAMVGCASLGLRVPDDVSITGFDDMDFARCTIPPLTTVRVDADAIGRHAGERIIALISGSGPQNSVQLPVDLIVRGSTGAPRLVA